MIDPNVSTPTIVETGHLIGITDAATALGVNASTVSRYVAKHPELNRVPERRRPLVDLDELRSHRESTLIAAAPEAPAPAPSASSVGAAPAVQPARTGPSYTDSRAARESVKAYKERLDLDVILGRLVPKAEVEDAAHESGQLLQSLLMDLVPRLADELAVLNDPQIIGTRLEEEFRGVLLRFTETLEVLKREHEAA